uniref:RNA dependent RNA polymerase n=1 Tax=Rosellinia necatrix partitivirus 22 TaxID=2699390 RepID=A0A6F8QGV1_9VIRU|nr:RNA dependent RNA polymerase [Rosellinia necatrix partitivirus 22]
MTENLTYVKYIPESMRSAPNVWKIARPAMEARNEWLERQMRKFYTDEEVDQVMTNRRSADSDEALMEDFFRCEFPKHEIPQDKNFNDAIELVTEHFRPERVLHPVSFPDLRNYPFELAVSAERPFTDPTFKFKPTDRDVDMETGVPKVSKRGAKKLKKWTKHTDVNTYLRWKQSVGLTDNSGVTYHNLYNEIFIYNRPLIHMIKEGEEPFWKDGKPIPYQELTLHMRSHVVAATEPDKIRAVFGAPKLLLHAELTFIWPLQASYLNGKSGRMLWGREMNRGGWRKLFQEMHRHGPPKTILGVDWSQFDKRLLHQLIRVVHKIWRQYFDFTKYERTNKYPNANPRDPRRIERLWEWMCNAITDTPILLPNGQVWRWNWNGFGSGFQQTQLMDTFANAIMIYTCLLAMGVNVRAKEFWARFQGDDSIIAFFERMFQLFGPGFLIMLEECAKHYFNAKLNVKESAIQSKADGMFVLGYFNNNGLAYRTDEDLLRHLMFPERPQDFGRLAASAVGLASASLGCSKPFYHLCKLIFNKIVHKKGYKVRWTALKWMIRAHIYENIDQLKKMEFPNYYDLCERRFAMTDRTESEMQNQWPTRPRTEESDFFFLDDITIPV